MLAIKKILFPTDFSPCAERAFSHAAFLKDWHDADLHVVNVVIVEESDDLDIFERPVLTQEELEERGYADIGIKDEGEYLGPPDKAPGSDFRQVEIRAFRTPDAIIDYVEEHDIDLVVMGTHGRHGVERLMLGSVTEEVVRKCTCPVLTVSMGKQKVPQRAIHRVLVPIDFSDQAQPAIRYAVEVAQTYGAEIDLLHVCSPALFSSPYAVEFDPAVMDQQKRVAEEMLADLASEEIGHEHVVATVEVGHPTSTILDFASTNNVDLIVIPTHGRSGLQRMMMGSVAEKVVRMAQCPVFTIKSFGKSLLPKKRRD